MTEWQDISTAPKDGTHIILFGHIVPSERHQTEYVRPFAVTGCWESLDDSWCAIPGEWDGPFVRATHWMPLPSPPTSGDE